MLRLAAVIWATAPAADHAAFARRAGFVEMLPVGEAGYASHFRRHICGVWPPQLQTEVELQPRVVEGEGDKDRTTLVAEAAVEPLKRHLVQVRQAHERALREGYGGVELPYALARKYPQAVPR